MENFLAIVTKPDNIPIVGLLFIIVYMTWYMLREGLRNDRLTEQGKGDQIYDRMNRWMWGDKGNDDV